MPVENSRLKAAILIANEVRGVHAVEDAKRLHDQNWEDYVIRSDEKVLSYEQFAQDSLRAKLLIDTVEVLLLSIPRKRAFAIGDYFGFWDGQQKTFAQVGKKIGIRGNSVLGLVRRGIRSFRHPSRYPHLKAFLKEDPVEVDVADEASWDPINIRTEDLAEKLLSLPPVYPYRKNP